MNALQPSRYEEQHEAALLGRLRPSPGPCGADEPPDSQGTDDDGMEHARRIVAETARAHMLPAAALTGPSRKRPIVSARGEAIRRIGAETNLPLKAIGLLLGGRDHSTIWHHLRNGRAA